jgi:hypothetical protein
MAGKSRQAREEAARLLAEGKKCCGRCGVVKPLEDFGPERSKPDGRRPWCRECTRAYDLEALKTPAGRARTGRATRRYRKTPAGRAAGVRDKVKRRARHRQQVFGHYGTVCACCGSAERLTIDHVDGDGREHREELFGHGGRLAGWRFYAWLVSNGFPEGFQTLCMPCNVSKGKGERCRLDHRR